MMKLPLEGRWLGLAALIAIAFTGVLMLAVRFVNLPSLAPAVKPPTQHAAGIGIAAVDNSPTGASHEDRSLLDPNPLFLPTEFNASQLKLPPLIRREPGTSLQPVSAKFAYTVAEAPVSFPEVVAVPAAPVDALSFGRVQNPYEVFGRLKRAESALAGRQAFVEVVHTRTGRAVFSASLVAPEAPAQLATVDWRPLELLAAVDATGLIGLPVLSRGSGVEVIDTFFRSYLAKQFHLGERLPPGLYSLRVGP